MAYSRPGFFVEAPFARQTDLRHGPALRKTAR
jgi:hypothetical protein